MPGWRADAEHLHVCLLHNESLYVGRCEFLTCDDMGGCRVRVYLTRQLRLKRHKPHELAASMFEARLFGHAFSPRHQTVRRHHARKAVSPGPEFTRDVLSVQVASSSSKAIRL